MNNIKPERHVDEYSKTIVAAYRSHAEAEVAVHGLFDGGMPIDQISLIGRDFEAKKDIEGFYRPADVDLDGARTGAWVGGIFGLMLGTLGFFAIPAIGPLMVLGPLAGIIAGRIGGAEIGDLVNGLVISGIPHDQALKYQERLKDGEFLIVAHGDSDEMTTAHKILNNTATTDLKSHVRPGVNSALGVGKT